MSKGIMDLARAAYEDAAKNAGYDASTGRMHGAAVDGLARAIIAADCTRRLGGIGVATLYDHPEAGIDCVIYSITDDEDKAVYVVVSDGAGYEMYAAAEWVTLVTGADGHKAQRNFTDPESPIMKMGDGAFDQAYNCQDDEMVDAAHALTVADPNDDAGIRPSKAVRP